MNQSPAPQEHPPGAANGPDAPFDPHVESLPDVVYRLDLNLRHLYLSPVAEQIVGKRVEEFLGRTGLEAGMPACIWEPFAVVCREAIASGEPRVYEFTYDMPHGLRWMEARITLERGPDGAVQSLLGITRDVSRQKRTEQALREREGRLRAYVAHSPFGIFVADALGRFVEVKPAACQITGRSEGELLGMSMMELLSEESREAALHDFAQFQQSGRSSGEWAWIHQDGSKHWSTVEVVWLSADRLLALCQDTTDRKRAEAALRESEQRYRGVVENQSELIARFLPGGVVTFANEALCRYFGTRHADLIGRSYFPWLFPEDLEHLQRELAAITPEHPVSCSENRVGFPGGEVRWLQWSNCGIFDERGQLLEYQSVGRDVTDRKRAESERLEMERQLLRAQKLESLGVLAGGIAHDFNNLLSAIVGNLDLVLRGLPADSILRCHVDLSLQAARRATDLTRQMLAYSGKGHFCLSEVDLSALVDENAPLLRACIAKNATLELDLARGLPPVTADPGQIHQVLMNLVTNAAEAIGRQPGVVALRTGEAWYDHAELALSRLDRQPGAGRFVFVEIADSGCGMNAETQRRLFEPFFSTKFTGRGLGMAAVHGILQAHHGAIFVESAAGRGTTVRALFPVAARESRPAEQSPAVPAAPSRAQGALSLTATVLVVDDEELVRNSCAALVGSSGLRALMAADGDEAVEVYRKHASEIACVILDLTMPKKDGLAALREMRAIDPQVKVVLVSGYDAAEADRRFAGEGLAGFLQKPYGLDGLMEQIRRVLGGSGPAAE